jgi:hypothetical protein
LIFQEATAMGTLLQSADIRYTSHYGEGLDCVRCGAQTAMRCHRKFPWEFLRTRLTGKVPFRCQRCRRRFWQWIDPRDR